ncbi:MULTISPECIES: alkylmercury lyase family protein [unclassified Tenacibaculum]|uniref:alkylmercury lyase family protein n=1 Tax=unclassified Tenacibaculum TaxID=2635139 RepID=UPI001F2577CA|nr:MULTISPECIES: alkylmercury lyase family protein [unclassified Tenacibaculum]MCF2875787.1 alkylmercury lyase family protein [Tenacibaculum sp. Cn5-1]MCF2935863.1 alkylmercury lyase family protein [Tenacibaculum sp. Cn5-34]MCG7512423.1 alkylmercury lyase family protein [Tenacibaculum sp. Cn5-46]
MVTKSSLHYSIIRYIIDNGFAPDSQTLATILKSKKEIVEKGLYELQEYHGVVLHPNEPKIWVIHPFSLAPTNFLVKSKRGEWWGNCAWCSLGLAALLNEDLKIITNYGAHGEKVEINIINGKIQEEDLYIHFPIPMKNAWDNVIYTCSTMLVFKNEKQIDHWVKQHNIPKGDIQPITKIWEFSKVWYGNHLNPDWKKWTMKEAQELFTEFNLTGKIWSLHNTNGRF